MPRPTASGSQVGGPEDPPTAEAAVVPEQRCTDAPRRPDPACGTPRPSVRLSSGGRCLPSSGTAARRRQPGRLPNCCQNAALRRVQSHWRGPRRHAQRLLWGRTPPLRMEEWPPRSAGLGFAEPGPVPWAGVPGFQKAAAVRAVSVRAACQVGPRRPDRRAPPRYPRRPATRTRPHPQRERHPLRRQTATNSGLTPNPAKVRGHSTRSPTSARFTHRFTPAGRAPAPARSGLQPAQHLQQPQRRADREQQLDVQVRGRAGSRR